MPLPSASTFVFSGGAAACLAYLIRATLDPIRPAVTPIAWRRATARFRSAEFARSPNYPDAIPPHNPTRTRRSNHWTRKPKKNRSSGSRSSGEKGKAAKMNQESCGDVLNTQPCCVLLISSNILS